MGKKRQKDRLGNRGSRKLYRNKKKCEQYRLFHTRERNRDARMARVAKRLAQAAARKLIRASNPVEATHATAASHARLAHVTGH